MNPELGPKNGNIWPLGLLRNDFPTPEHNGGGGVPL